MTVYRIVIGENEYRIEVTEDVIRINGEEVEADLHKLNDAGLFLLNHGEEKLELHLATQGNNTYMVTADGRQIETQVETDQGKIRQKHIQTDNKIITAPIPGVVLEVRVAVGEEVEEGHVVCILESMKMQMVIKSPVTGQVAEISVEPGQNIDKGEVMIRLE